MSGVPESVFGKIFIDLCMNIYLNILPEYHNMYLKYYKFMLCLEFLRFLCMIFCISKILYLFSFTFIEE